MLEVIEGFRSTDGTFFEDEEEAVNYEVSYLLRDSGITFYDAYGNELDFSKPFDVSFEKVDFIRIATEKDLSILYDIGETLWQVREDSFPPSAGLFHYVDGVWYSQEEELNFLVDSWGNLWNGDA